MTFNITESLEHTMANNYIGEFTIIPTILYCSIHEILHNITPQPIQIYYYGEITHELLIRFGYIEEPKFEYNPLEINSD